MYWVFILSTTIILVILSWYVRRNNKVFKKQEWMSNAKAGTCSRTSCGAIDPVNDPDYNMRNVVKQSILLEEHLAEKNKYCKSCIVKHFLHIIGLLEEAIWLAGSDVDKYPHLIDSSSFYQNLMDKWLPKKDDDTVRKEVLSSIRERRRQLIDTYFM